MSRLDTYRQTWNLIVDLCDQGLDADQHCQLERLLSEDEESRALYFDYIDLITDLRQQAIGNGQRAHFLEQLAADEQDSAAMPLSVPERAWGAFYGFVSHNMVLSAIISGLFISIILLSLALIVPDWGRSTPNVAEVDPPRPAVVARITAMHRAAWDASSDADFKNIELFAGERLVLNSGLAVVEYGTGARVVLEGPATYHIEGANAGDLLLGKLVARVDTPHSQGFAVQIPGARVVDRGTEFAVKVDESQATDMIVLEGKVAVEQHAAGAGQPQSRTLTAGQSLRIDAQGNAAGQSRLSARSFARDALRPDFFAQDDFDRYPDGNLVGRGSSADWGWRGAWQQGNPSQPKAKVAGGVVRQPNGGTAFRVLNKTIGGAGDAGKTYSVSFDLQTAAANFSVLELRGPDGPAVTLGYQYIAAEGSSSPNLAIYRKKETGRIRLVALPASIMDGVHTYRMEFTFGATGSEADVVALFVDDVSQGAAVDLGTDFAFDRVAIQAFANAAAVTHFDNLVIASVNPSLEESR